MFVVPPGDDASVVDGKTPGLGGVGEHQVDGVLAHLVEKGLELFGCHCVGPRVVGGLRSTKRHCKRGANERTRANAR